MKAFVLFQIVFYSVIEIVDTYNSDLLINIGHSRRTIFHDICHSYFDWVGIAISLKKTNREKFKRKQNIVFISLMYIGACIAIGDEFLLYGKVK